MYFSQVSNLVGTRSVNLSYVINREVNKLLFLTKKKRVGRIHREAIPSSEFLPAVPFL